MSEFSFGKSERLAKRPQFDDVIDRGQKHRIENLCTVFFLPNGLNRKRLGIITSKRIGNAVARNKARRKIREIFRCIKNRIEPAVDVVIISGRDLILLPSSVLEKKFLKSLPKDQKVIKKTNSPL